MCSTQRADGAPSGLCGRVRGARQSRGGSGPRPGARGRGAGAGSRVRQARRYVNVALEQPEGVPVPERTMVFTVRLAPSLIGGLRERAGATGQTLSAVTADAVRGYLLGAGERGGGQAS